LTAVNLKNTAIYYGNQYKSLKLDGLKLKNRIRFTQTAFNNVRNQIGGFSSKKEFASGEAIIKIKATKTTTIQLELV
jgi:hypothetical protein